HVSGGDQPAGFIRGDGARNIQGFVDEYGLRVAEILFIGIEVEDLLDARWWRRFGFLLTRTERGEEQERQQGGAASLNWAASPQHEHARPAASSAGRGAMPRAPSSAAPRSLA